MVTVSLIETPAANFASNFNTRYSPFGPRGDQEAAMNGIHDLGGMHGFGPVEPEQDEPPFHDDWEAVMVAIQGYGLR